MDMGDSKTNRLILLAAAVIILIFVASVAVLVLFNKDPITLAAAALTSFTSLVGGGIYRNVKTDTPIRQQEASLNLAIRAQNLNQPLEVDPAASAQQPGGLAVWRPTGGTDVR